MNVEIVEELLKKFSLNRKLMISMLLMMLSGFGTLLGVAYSRGVNTQKSQDQLDTLTKITTEVVGAQANLGVIVASIGTRLAILEVDVANNSTYIKKIEEHITETDEYSDDMWRRANGFITGKPHKRVLDLVPSATPPLKK